MWTQLTYIEPGQSLASFLFFSCLPAIVPPSVVPIDVQLSIQLASSK